MKWIMADKVLTIMVYDEEHEDYLQKRMTVEEILDAYTDEGCPTIYANPELREPAKATEIPIHGRLIDADALAKVMCEGISPSDGNGGFTHPFDILRTIANAPTVIEASRGGEQGV